MPRYKVTGGGKSASLASVQQLGLAATASPHAAAGLPASGRGRGSSGRSAFGGGSTKPRRRARGGSLSSDEAEERPTKIVAGRKRKRADAAEAMKRAARETRDDKSEHEDDSDWNSDDAPEAVQRPKVCRQPRAFANRVRSAAVLFFPHRPPHPHRPAGRPTRPPPARAPRPAPPRPRLAHRLCAGSACSLVRLETRSRSRGAWRRTSCAWQQGGVRGKPRPARTSTTTAAGRRPPSSRGRQARSAAHFR
jgi:hypothetical protein